MSDDDRQMTDPPTEAAGLETKRSLLTRSVLYPDVYLWYVFLAALDIMLTWLILQMGGREENALAKWIIAHGGLVGAVLFKFGTVVFVVLICEYIGRRRAGTGRRVAEWAIALTAIPVVVAIVQLLYVFLSPGGPTAT